MIARSAQNQAPDGITVVIAAYKALPLLEIQLDALAVQTYDGPIQVIVSDNEGSPELRKYVESYRARDAIDLTWIDSSQMRGTAYARTNGGKHAKYEFIAFTDQDDRADSGWVAAMAEAARSYDLVGGRLDQESLNDSEVKHWRDVSSVDELPVWAKFLQFANGCNFGLWREVFDAIGGWDETYVPGEDIDICLRAQLHGYTIGYATDAVVAYRFRTTIKETWQQSIFYQDGEARLYRQYRSDGAKRRSVIHWLDHAAWVVIRCPVIPGNWSRAHRGKWCFHAGVIAGRIKGSVKYRVFYP